MYGCMMYGEGGEGLISVRVTGYPVPTKSLRCG